MPPRRTYPIDTSLLTPIIAQMAIETGRSVPYPRPNQENAVRRYAGTGKTAKRMYARVPTSERVEAMLRAIAEHTVIPTRRRGEEQRMVRSAIYALAITDWADALDAGEPLTLRTLRAELEETAVLIWFYRRYQSAAPPQKAKKLRRPRYGIAFNVTVKGRFAFISDRVAASDIMAFISHTANGVPSPEVIIALALTRYVRRHIPGMAIGLARHSDSDL